MEITNKVVANAVAAQGVAKNAKTVEEQREFARTELPKFEAAVDRLEKDCESIHAQVKAAIAKTNGVAQTISALEKKAEAIKKPMGWLRVYEYDEKKGRQLEDKISRAYDKIIECRDLASKAGYDIVNSFRIYSISY